MTPQTQPSLMAVGSKSNSDAQPTPRRAANSRPDEDTRSNGQNRTIGGVDALLRAYPSLVHEIE